VFLSPPVVPAWVAALHWLWHNSVLKYSPAMPKRWRICLAELCGAHVGSDLKSAAAFPTDHELHLGGLTLRIGDEVAVRTCTWQ
jgi:hypothetical protein